MQKIQTKGLSVLCAGGTESRNHLLFECNYSWSLWLASASRCGFTPPTRDWSLTLSTLGALRLSPPKTRLLLLAWQLVVYSIWFERNTRIHRLTYRSTDSLFSTIDRTLRNKIQTLRQSNPQLCSQMMEAWLSTAPWLSKTSLLTEESSACRQQLTSTVPPSKTFPILILGSIMYFGLLFFYVGSLHSLLMTNYIVSGD